jgi:peptide/nickel transport system permease protein
MALFVGGLIRARESDMFHAFRRSRVTVIATVVAALYILAALFAPFISLNNPFEMANAFLLDAHTPPSWIEGGVPQFIFGTDDLGRDIFSLMLYGSRISIAVGFASVVFAAVLGITLGLISGYAGGRTDAIIMRIADIQLTFPAILIALLIQGVARAVLGDVSDDTSVFWILTLSVGLSFWVQFARTVRGSTLVEKNKEYVQAARIIGRSPIAIMVRHVLPNVLGPVLVIATISLALAIILEATLSFLGVGFPPTTPSLGTQIATGQRFLYSGEWWMTAFPAAALAILALSVNLLGDWLRDALNPKLR